METWKCLLYSYANLSCKSVGTYKILKLFASNRRIEKKKWKNAWEQQFYCPSYTLDVVTIVITIPQFLRQGLETKHMSELF